MEFRTPLSIQPSGLQITHQTQIFTLGSCFANVIGEKLHSNKFPVRINPFGTIFNPLSIFRLLHSLIRQDDRSLTGSVVENKGIWYNYHLHSDFSALTQKELEEKTIRAIEESSQLLAQTNVLTITLGTAFVYRLLPTQEIVANCHKIPAANFRKELLSPASIFEGFEEVYATLKGMYPSLQIILTVSPVRHLKDGMEHNSISKSILRYACHLIRQRYPEVDYFPAYELMMDDLRDYRFYKEDMIHPTEVAENYIWNKFTEKFIPRKSQEFIKEWEEVLKAIAHKPFHPASDAHQKFLRETIRKLEKLSTLIDVSKELEEVKTRIIP